ncbi:MAG TPA: choice-of-anchor D domain-containing protein, partial [Sedimentisphaerales bacterium]|nr:choice-of-anchor D domain-containing protein [Sedimentisphaerales bacterium]
MPSLEVLEPRLLLNADFVGAEPLRTLDVQPCEQVIQVDLRQHPEMLQDADPSLILTCFTSTEEPQEATTSSVDEGQISETQVDPLCVLSASVVNDSTPLEGIGESEFGIEIAVGSEESAAQFCGQSACLIPVDGQDDLSSTDDLPIQARGPPVRANHALSVLCAITYGDESQPCVVAGVEGVSTENGTKAPVLPGLKLVDPDLSNWQGQIIYLDFDGEQNVTYNGPVTIGPFDVPAFQAPAELAGQEQAIIDQILSNLQDIFAGSGIIFMVEEPEDGTQYSTIYIGGDGAAFAQYGSFLGLAERVDVGNRDRGDQGLVFGGQFTGASSDAYVMSLTGVIAHEAGHLAGYSHTVDERAECIENVAAIAADDDRTFVHPSEDNSETKNLTLPANTYTFCIDANPDKAHKYQWYDTYSDNSEPVEQGALTYYDNHDFTFSGGSTYWVRAEVYDSGWNWEAAYRWYVTAYTPKPDLIVVDVWTVPASVVEGQGYKIQATIKNQGTATADAGLSANQEALFYVDGVKYGEGDDYDNLAAGDSITVESISLTGPSAGSHTIKVVADGNSEVTESNEGNNERSESITVSAQSSAPSRPGDPAASNVTATSARVNWSKSTDPDGGSITYTIQWKGDWTPTWVGAESRTTANTYYDVTGLTPEKVYDVRVKASDGSLDSAWNGKENVIETSFILDFSVNELDEDQDGFASKLEFEVAVNGGIDGFSNASIRVMEDDWFFDDPIATIEGVTVAAGETRVFSKTVVVAKHAKLWGDGIETWWPYRATQFEFVAKLYDGSEMVDSAKFDQGTPTHLEILDGAYTEHIQTLADYVKNNRFKEYFDQFGGKPVLTFGGKLGVKIEDLAKILAGAKVGSAAGFGGTAIGAVAGIIASFCVTGPTSTKAGYSLLTQIDLYDLMGLSTDASFNIDKSQDLTDDWITVWQTGGIYEKAEITGKLGLKIPLVDFEIICGVTTLDLETSSLEEDPFVWNLYNELDDVFKVQLLGNQIGATVGVAGEWSSEGCSVYTSEGLLPVKVNHFDDKIPLHVGSSTLTAAEFSVGFEGKRGSAITYEIRADIFFGIIDAVLHGLPAMMLFGPLGVTHYLTSSEGMSFAMLMAEAMQGLFYGHPFIRLPVQSEPEIDVEIGAQQDVHFHDFGQVASGASVSQVFTIRNEGDAYLIVDRAEGLSAPFSISPTNGSDASDDWLILPGQTKQFAVTYSPSAEGTYEDLLTLWNYDDNEYTYLIRVVGTTAGLPEIEVKQHTTVIADDSPYEFGFGSARQGDGSIDVLFAINNLGGQALSIGTIYLDNNNGFSVTQQPASSVAAHGTTTFTISLLDAATGPKSADVRFANGDSNENPFNFRIVGEVTPLQNNLPTIGAFSNSPDPVVSVDNLTLTASDVNDLDGYVRKVKFYRDSNASGVLEIGIDELLGSDSEASDGWTWVGSTAEFPLGLNRYFAQAQDDEGAWSAAATSTGTVDPPETHVPEIEVLGNGNVIPDGDTTPSPDDHTEFGNVDVASGSVTRTFTIYNAGTGTLSLTGDPRVSLTGSSDFQVLTQPSSSVDPLGSVTFQIRFDPSSEGLKTAHVSIANTDEDEDPYDFVVCGRGAQPELTILVIDFDHLPDNSATVTGQVVGEDYASWGVHFRSIGVTESPQYSDSHTPTRMASAGQCSYPPGFNIVADFDIPVYGVTANVSSAAGGTIRMIARDRDGNEIASVISDPIPSAYDMSKQVQLVSDVPIASVEWWPSQNNHGVGIDDLRIQVLVEPVAVDLVWSRYLGGSDRELGYGVATDSQGNVYVTGATRSSGWLGSGDYAGGYDVFVMKLTSSGGHVWSRYFGGSGYEGGTGLAVDSEDCVYITGDTTSDGWISRGFDTTRNGDTDAFVLKLSSDGELLWSSYVGGSSREGGFGIAVDADGGVYVTGLTSSDVWDGWSFGNSLAGGVDGFVVKLTSDGDAVCGRYLGGDGENYEFGYAIAADGVGGVYVAGATMSSDWLEEGEYAGGGDGFVAKFTADLLSPAWGRYLGGAGADYGWAMAVGSGGRVYVSGETSSSEWGGWEFGTSNHGGIDAFVVELTANSGSPVWGQFLGGTGSQKAYGIAVGPQGHLYVTGETGFSDWLTGGLDLSYGGGDRDVFVAELNTAGSLLWSTYLGGAGFDYGWGIAADAAGSVYISGHTESSEWADDGLGTTYGDGEDGFVAKLMVAPVDQDDDVTVSVSPSAVSEDGSTNLVYTFTRSVSSPSPLTVNFNVIGTGTFNTDYTQSGAASFSGVSGSVTIAANQTTASVTINPTADLAVEPNETVILTVTSGTGYTPGSPATATGTILNDDIALAIAATDATKDEGNTGSSPSTEFTFTVTRAGMTTGTTTVNWAVTGSGTNPADATDFSGQVLPSGTVSFGVGETNQPVTVNVYGDTTPEADEGFTVTLFGASGGAQITVPTATGIIRNDDPDYQWVSYIPTPQQTTIDVETHGAGTRATVTINFPASGYRVLDWGSIQHQGNMFLAVNAQPEQWTGPSAAVMTPISHAYDLGVLEAGNYTFAFGAWGQPVESEDFAVLGVTLAIAATDATKDEGNTGSSPSTEFTFTVTRAGMTTGTTTVDWEVTGSGINPADATDFLGRVLPSGRVSFGVGETNQMLAVYVYGDNTPEADEAFTVTLLSAWDGDQIITPTATGTILNDDYPVIVVDRDLLVIPEGSTAAFRVKLSTQPASAVTVTVSRYSGDSDIAVSEGTSLTFTTGNWDTYQTVTLLAVQDTDTTSGTATIRCSASGLPDKGVMATEQDNNKNWPDLQVTGVDSSIWQSAEPGTVVDWTVVVKNNGPGYQRADWKVEWYLSNDPVYQATDPLIGSGTYEDDIAPGASVNKSIAAPVPAMGTAGQKYVIARVTNLGPEGTVVNNVKVGTDLDWIGVVAPDGDEENDTRETA